MYYVIQYSQDLDNIIILIQRFKDNPEVKKNCLKIIEPGTFHVKMSTIKDRNGMDLTEAEDVKRWQEYTELYKKAPPGPHP